MLKLVLIRKRRMTLIMIMTLAKMVKTMIMRMTPKLIHQQKNTTVW